MKRVIALVTAFICVGMLSSCMKRGPYQVELHQSTEEIVRIDLFDGSPYSKREITMTV